MAQMVMWVGLVVAGLTLVILLLSTTSNNLSLSFNTNHLFHFLNINGTKHLCPPDKAKELCSKPAAPPAASRLSTEENASKNVANSPNSEEDKEAREETLAKGFSAWWQLQLRRKVLVARVCARYLFFCQ